VGFSGVDSQIRLLSQAEMRRRGSGKWDVPPDVLGMADAESDVRVADAVVRAVAAAVRASDLGPVSAAAAYALFEDLAAFARRRWAWHCDPSAMVLAPSVTTAIGALLASLLPAGSVVAYSSPVFRPFKDLPGRTGHVPLDVPLLRNGTRWGLDLEALSLAFARPRVRAYLLCQPHNPIGATHPAADLRALAALAASNGVLVVSDEAHAPLARAPGFRPFLTSGPEAASCGWAVTTAAKAWNLSGAKCAIAVRGSSGAQVAGASFAAPLRWETGRLAVTAARACYTDGVAWLDEFNGMLAVRYGRLAAAARAAGALPAHHDSGHLAWIDYTGTSLEEDPAAGLLRAGLSVAQGHRFGPGGAAHVRINYAASEAVFREACKRLSGPARHQPEG
jgi:cystathionine beta-lyase